MLYDTRKRPEKWMRPFPQHAHACNMQCILHLVFAESHLLYLGITCPGQLDVAHTKRCCARSQVVHVEMNWQDD